MYQKPSFLQVLFILQNGTLHMSEDKKIKVFVISDHPFAPSGVGTQTKYIIDALIKTGRYKFFCFGGAIKHHNYDQMSVDGYEEDWVIQPVDGYGTQEMVRSVIYQFKPDVIWYMTDPRFYEWLWDMENEIRTICPMIYYHVWDNYPLPRYNKSYYESTDVIASISKVTYDIVNKVAPSVENHYLPHAVNLEIFKRLDKADVDKFREEHFPDDSGRITFFWNNRNARRKLSGSVLWWFNEFAEQIGPDKVRLIMHTEPNDQHGQDLTEMIKALNADDGRIILSVQKVPPEILSFMYNTADCTINIADAEGFGLATLESLACETPIIVTMTGGLQEQVTDGKEWFGIGLEPASKVVIGSQQVPYIYEDRVGKEDFIDALNKMYKMSKTDRDKLGKKGRKHIEKNYNFDKYGKRWIELMDNIHEKYGSWDTRKGYKAWNIKELK